MSNFIHQPDGSSVEVPLTLQEATDQAARKAVEESAAAAREAALLASQARKDVFKALNDNQPVTVGNLRGILEDAGVI